MLFEEKVVKKFKVVFHQKMLFDTPGLNIPSTSVPVAAPNAFEKRRNAASKSKSKSKSTEAPINLEKLMKTMRKDSGWGKELGEGGKSGIEQTEKDEATRLRRAEARRLRTHNKKVKGESTADKGASTAEKGETGKIVTEKVKHRFDPAVNSVKHKKEKKLSKAAAAALAAEEASGFSPASSSNFIEIPNHSSTVDTTPSSPPPTKSTKSFVAPNHSPVASTSSAPPQTAMQISLRAKLAGGRFRMLNETLYTSTGEEAAETMKEEGAFDDVSLTFLPHFFETDEFDVVPRWIPITISSLASSSSRSTHDRFRKITR